jgi:hypothetical protein
MVAATMFGVAFLQMPAYASQCADAIAAANRAVEAEVEHFDEMVGASLSNAAMDLKAAQCAARDKTISLAQVTIRLKRAAESVCQGQNRTQCDSACAEQRLSERIAELDASCTPAAAPATPQAAARPPMRRQRGSVGVCQCFSIEQLARSGSQYPFRATNNCPVAVSYTYASCEAVGQGSVDCKESVGYLSANSSDGVTGYNEGQPTRLLRACGPGGACCTP